MTGFVVIVQGLWPFPFLMSFGCLYNRSQTHWDSEEFGLKGSPLFIFRDRSARFIHSYLLLFYGLKNYLWLLQ